MRFRLAMLCCWIDLSQERSPWWFLKFENAPLTFININRNTALQRKGMEIAMF
jgi:hypothetical protein